MWLVHTPVAGNERTLLQHHINREMSKAIQIYRFNTLQEDS